MNSPLGHWQPSAATKVKRQRKPANPASRDPLVRSLRKAYRESAVGKLELLLAEESRWKRKHTIAVNKLAWLRQQIQIRALELAREQDMRTLP